MKKKKIIEENQSAKMKVDVAKLGCAFSRTIIARKKTLKESEACGGEGTMAWRTPQ